MFHPRYHELIPLVTDSMFIRAQNKGVETTRAIGFRYKDKLPNGWKETSVLADLHRVCIYEQYNEITGNGVIIYEIHIDSLFRDTLRSRQIIYGASQEQPDSVFMEVWAKDAWEPRQKTVNFYDSDHFLVRKLDWNWDVTAIEWKPQYQNQIIYDNKKRIVQKQELEWTDTDVDWILRQNYFFAYRSGENKPKYEVWYAGNLPMDSTVMWYDANASLDSMRHFIWEDHTKLWKPANKRIFDSQEAKIAENGAFYLAEKDQNLGTTDQWIQKERREFTGNNDFTDEPEVESLRKLNPKSGEWEEYWRRTVRYSTLSDGKIYAKLDINERVPDGSLLETFSAEAWMHIAPDSLQSPPIEERAGKFTISYTCGLYNPYVLNQTLTFPETEVSGDYELKIYSGDSRLVYQQSYGNSDLAKVSAPLAPGVYLVSVSKGGVPLCTQKLIVN